jgi:hypothetical protein
VNLNKMMKDLQRMQEKRQADMDALEVEASSGGGMVTVRMNGKKQVVSIKLSPEAVTPDDLGLMEDLVLAAVNEAGRRVDDEVQRMTQGMTAGLRIPGMPL